MKVNTHIPYNYFNKKDFDSGGILSVVKTLLCYTHKLPDTVFLNKEVPAILNVKT